MGIFLGDHGLINKAADDKCPIATKDVAVNLAHREKAIKTANYGPLNPAEPNTEFWKKKADRWDLSVIETKKSKCGNCAAFIKTPKMLACIESGLSAGDPNEKNSFDTIKAGDLGYCEAFDFKCASARTCDAWISGGPVTKAKDLKVGDFVRWDSNGSVAQGKIEHIMREGVLGVPDSSFSIKAEKTNPAILIRIYKKFADGWKETETLVGHKASTLRSIQDLA